MNEICLSFNTNYKNPYPKGSGHITCAILCAEADRMLDREQHEKNKKQVYVLPSLDKSTHAKLDTPVYDVIKKQSKE